MERPAHSRSGFTLVELMVALAIAGLLAGMMFQVIGGQGLFVQTQSAREEVQQNSRATLELVGSELRALPPSDGLEMATADSFTVRVPRAWGVVCSVGTGSVNVTLPRLSGVSWSVNTGTHLVADVRVPGTAAADWTGPVAVTAVGAAAAACDGSTASTREGRSVTIAAALTSPSSGRSAAPGDAAYLFDRVTYRTGASAGTPGTWIQRRIGTGANQPLAGPILPDGNGWRILYFEAGSSTPLSPPLTQAQRRSVDRILLVVGTANRNVNGRVQQAQVDTMVISLRNRVGS